MNILVDQFPSKVKIDGKDYGLNTDFRIGLKIMFAMQDDGLTMQEKMIVMLQLLYKEIPNDLEKAVEYAIAFLNCNEHGKEKAGISVTLFSCEKDAKYIYSAIRQSHGIDLDNEKIHWWKFMYMFLDLNPDCFFNRLVGVRDRKAKGKMDKADKEFYRQNKDIIDLPLKLSPEEKLKIEQFRKLLGKAGDESG